MSLIGKQIHHYEIKKLIGEGGMGNVYLAEHMKLGRKVAIKSLHAKLAGNESIRMRFKNEASTMALLQHPAIVALYDYLEEPDGLYLVMEYVDGKPLDEYIKNVSGPIPQERAVKLMKQILEGFAYAHEHGIVHRDIKPSNILLTHDDKTKILDFGIAKILNDADRKLTKTGTQVGTIYYMCPEQVRGEAVDPRSDIYSLGVTFFQMLTGMNPYKDLTTEYEIYSKIVNEPLPKASSIYPGVTKGMEAILEKATAKNPADRYTTCKEFIQALRALKDEVVADSFEKTAMFDKTTIVPPPVSEPANPPKQNFTQQEQPKAKPAAQPAENKKSSKTWIFAVLGVVLIAVAVFFIVNKNKNDDKELAEKNRQDSIAKAKKDDSIRKAEQTAANERRADSTRKADSTKMASVEQIAALIEKGDQYFKSRDYTNALKSYEEAAVLDPSNADLQKKIADTKKKQPNTGIPQITPDPPPTVPVVGTGTVYKDYDVDVVPEYPGGFSAFSEFVSNKMRYPSKERNAGIEGTVFVMATVEKDGRLTNTRVIKGVEGGPGLSTEAIRIVNAMPKWRPGKKDGEVVRVDHKIQIRFVLTN
ncbi:MAG: hypothetical protein Fur0041_00240 [Bacteroidia bacterium]